MKKEKLTLEQLNVTSFTTSAQKDTKGGTGTSGTTSTTTVSINSYVSCFGPCGFTEDTKCWLSHDTHCFCESMKGGPCLIEQPEPSGISDGGTDNRRCFMEMQ